MTILCIFKWKLSNIYICYDIKSHAVSLEFIISPELQWMLMYWRLPIGSFWPRGCLLPDGHQRSMQEHLQQAAAVPHHAGRHDLLCGRDADAHTDGHFKVRPPASGLWLFFLCVCNFWVMRNVIVKKLFFFFFLEEYLEYRG